MLTKEIGAHELNLHLYCGEKRMTKFYLDAGSSQEDVVPPLHLESAVLLRLGVDELLHVGGADIGRHQAHGGRKVSTGTARQERVQPEKQTKRLKNTLQIKLLQ